MADTETTCYWPSVSGLGQGVGSLHRILLFEHSLGKATKIAFVDSLHRLFYQVYHPVTFSITSGIVAVADTPTMRGTPICYTILPHSCITIR